MRSIGTAVVAAAVLVCTLGLGIWLGWGANELTYHRAKDAKSCDCRPCPCPRGDGRRTGQPTGDVAADEKGGGL